MIPKGSNEFGSEEASLKAKAILTKFRNENDLVIHIQHFSTRADSTFLYPPLSVQQSMTT